jgi:hypothetical protein
MKKIISRIVDWINIIMLITLFAFIFTISIVQFKWLAIIVILSAFIFSALFIAFLTLACLCGRYVIDHRKLTGFIKYINSK